MESNTTTNGFEETAQNGGHEEKSVKFVDNNNEGESHVTQAEVNHQIISEESEPTPPKRNVFPESEEEKDVSTNGGGDETDGTIYSSSAVPHTSENFIKIEERNVIERLSKVIDAELSIESLRVDTEDTTPEDTTPEVTTDAEPKLEEEESTTEPEESKPEESEPEPEKFTHESEADQEVSKLEVSQEREESVENNTQQTEETFEVSHEVRHEENSFEDNGLNTEESNHRNEEKNEEIFETQNENHAEESKPVVEDFVIKQNGRKVVYSSEEDVEEEGDQMTEIIGFKTMLNKWSTGKPGADDGSDSPNVSVKDKFKTLRQIKRGNTRSLMEKFQSPAKS